MIYLETESTDPAYNLAFEEYALVHLVDDDVVILWQNENAVIIGQNQNAEDEIDRAFVCEHGIAVVRRATGGGAVYHDLGNLNFSFITNYFEDAEASVAPFVDRIISALDTLGVDARQSGRNDILVNGKKVSGTAQRVLGNRILFHGTLLFDSDLSILSGALRANPKKFSFKNVKSVRARVGNIREALPRDMGIDLFKDHVKSELVRGGCDRHLFSQDQLDEIAVIKSKKYDTWEWNIGRSLPFSFENECRFDRGTLSFRALIEGGRMANVAFYGDFLSRKPLDEVEAALIGCRYIRKDVSCVLESFEVKDLFGGITSSQILSVIFPSS